MTTPTPTPTRYHACTVTPPPVGRAAIVWWWVGERRATWDGAHWRDENGQHLPGVTHWREDPAQP